MLVWENWKTYLKPPLQLFLHGERTKNRSSRIGNPSFSSSSSSKIKQSSLLGSISEVGSKGSCPSAMHSPLLVCYKPWV